MDKEVLNKILIEHCKWIKNNQEGKRADLFRADLSGAYLSGAYLSGAYLSGANLSGANLSGAYLSRAKIDYYKNNLDILKTIDNKGNIIAWKYEINSKSPYQNAEYKIGKTYKEEEYDYDEKHDCGKGLNVATLNWCFYDSIGKIDLTFLKVQFKSSDIVAIPLFSDGKFRVKKMEILSKHTLEEVKELLKVEE